MPVIGTRYRDEFTPYELFSDCVTPRYSINQDSSVKVINSGLQSHWMVLPTSMALQDVLGFLKERLDATITEL